MFEEELHVRLKDALFDTVGSRVYPMYLPQNASLPALVYNVISKTPENNLENSPTLEKIKVQVDAWATTYAGVKNLAVFTRNAMRNRLQAVLIQEQDLREDDFYRILLDFSIMRGV